MPIDPRLRNVLDRARAMVTTDCTIEFRGMPARDVKHALNNTVERAGLSQDVTVHTLRHACGSRVVQCGIFYALIGELLANSATAIEQN